MKIQDGVKTSAILLKKNSRQCIINHKSSFWSAHCVSLKLSQACNIHSLEVKASPVRSYTNSVPAKARRHLTIAWTSQSTRRRLWLQFHTVTPTLINWAASQGKQDGDGSVNHGTEQVSKEMIFSRGREILGGAGSKSLKVFIGYVERGSDGLCVTAGWT